MKTRPEAAFLHGRLCAGGCGLASLIVRRLRISATKETEELDDHFMIEKQYSFTQDSEVIGEETLNLGFYRQNAMDEILGEAGFEFERIDDDRQFFVYSNRSESPAASA
jgi:hypothetical protein